MNITERNFFRLVRCGAFQRKETIEPMSAYKWGKLYQLAVIHDVAAIVYQGLLASKDQFFLQLPAQQWERWEKTTGEAKLDSTENDDLLRADHLTNPLLNRKLQSILDDEQSDTPTRQFLLTILRTSRHILNEGVPVRELVTLGKEMQQESHKVNFMLLDKWIKSLKLQQVVQLEGWLLIHLLGFDASEIPFLGERIGNDVETVTQELIQLSSKRHEEFYFSQADGNIFVHTSNGNAMLGRLRRSARYFRYYPSETLTNFFASFVHSLSHIEE